MSTNPFVRRPFPPRHTLRHVPYRPSREERDRGGGFRLVVEFFNRYMWPHRLSVGTCILLSTLNACSVFLMAYYGKVVVDEILVVREGGHVVHESTAVVQARHEPYRTVRDTEASAERGRPTEARARGVESPAARDGRHEAGSASESFRAANASPRPPLAGRRLLGIFLMYLTTVVLLNLGARISNRARVRVAQHLTLKLREDMHRKIIGLSSSYHQTTTPGRLMARILSDVDVVQRHLLDVVQTSSSQSIMFLVGVTILSALDWRCTVAVLVAMGPYAWAMRKNHLRMKEINRELRHSNSCLWGLVSQKLDAIRAIYAYGREKTEMINFFRLSSVMQRDALEQQRLGASIGRAAQLIATLTTQGIFIYCATRVLDGGMSFGKMMYIHGAAANLFNPIIQLTQLTTSMSNLLVVLQRMTLTLRNRNVIADSPGAVDFPVPVRTGIVIENLSFQYDEEGDPVLNNIDLEIPAGRWLCIMGPSGSGKTTLVGLLARLYDPTEGAIRVDGLPLSSLRLSSLRAHLAMVPQEAQIISGTVRANITYGQQQASPDQIMEAAKAADCHEFVMNLPVKYETIIGEKGMTLSGGQRQRISIARALITNPDVLILDDCTSALDANTERKIQETLTRLLAGKTAVIVSQRVSMAMRCHRIIVLEDGHITERGTHERLLQRGGFYSRLHAQQTG